MKASDIAVRLLLFHLVFKCALNADVFDGIELLFQRGHYQFGKDEQRGNAAQPDEQPKVRVWYIE